MIQTHIFVCGSKNVANAGFAFFSSIQSFAFETLNQFPTITDIVKTKIPPVPVWLWFINTWLFFFSHLKCDLKKTLSGVSSTWSFCSQKVTGLSHQRSHYVPFFILYLRLSSSVMDFNSPLSHASLLIYSESSAAELDQYNLRLLLFLMLAEWRWKCHNKRRSIQRQIIMIC